MKILGIDPGLTHTGWGIITKQGHHLKYVACGTVSTSPKASMTQRLMSLDEAMKRIVHDFQPTHAAMEETFVNVNSKSSLKLGQARGALLLSLAQTGLVVNEYAARLIKKTVVGTGAADKAQIGMMVQTLLPGCREHIADARHDALDALAVAICDASHGMVSSF